MSDRLAQADYKGPRTGVKQGNAIGYMEFEGRIKGN